MLQLDDHQTGQPEPDERLALPRPADCSEPIVGVEARPWNRGVADPSGQLALDASGRDGDRQVSLRVSGDSPDRVGALHQLLTLAVGDEDGGVRHLDAVLPCEARGSFGRQEHVAAVLHHRHGQVDRVAHITQACCPARAQRGSFHHPGVELDHPIAVQASADAGVEKWLVLHVANRRDGRGQGTLADEGPSDLAGPLHSGLAQLPFGGGDWTGATVDDQRRADGRTTQ